MLVVLPVMTHRSRNRAKPMTSRAAASRREADRPLQFGDDTLGCAPAASTPRHHTSGNSVQNGRASPRSWESSPQSGDRLAALFRHGQGDGVFATTTLQFIMRNSLTAAEACATFGAESRRVQSAAVASDPRRACTDVECVEGDEYVHGGGK
jgi:hypothetical protein